VLENIETIAADLLHFHPEILPAEMASCATLYILIGSERGFCGDFNHTLGQHFDRVYDDEGADEILTIAIGHKLHVLFEEDRRVTTRIDGASVAEEIMALLQQLVTEILLQQASHGPLTVYCLYHESEEGVVRQQIMPPFRQPPVRPQHHRHPPFVQLPAQDLFFSLIDHYLFALLYEMLCASFMVENRKRIMHLEGAVKRLDDESDMLMRQCNSLRQEELIEEIEVVLLGANLSQGYAVVERYGENFHKR
jgi:F-type H+-transporting ATPase subunit gamma